MNAYESLPNKTFKRIPFVKKKAAKEPSAAPKNSFFYGIDKRNKVVRI